MRIIIGLFITSFLFCAAFSCNNKQGNEREEQEHESIDSLIVEELAIIDDYEPYISDINLFRVNDIDSTNTIFVSLSDIDHLSNHPDSIAVSIIEEEGFENGQYIHLESKYRERFLFRTGISVTDSVFVYNYANNSLASFLVKELKIVAKASLYVSAYDWPLPQDEYMFGFEIDQNKLIGFGDNLYDLLVYVGKENPFAQEQLTSIVWNEIASDRYPSKEYKGYYASYLKSSTMGNTYLFETDSLQYFLQNHHLNGNRDMYDTLRRLLVVEKSTKDIIADELFGAGEGISVSSLFKEDEYGISQWTASSLKIKLL